MRDLAVIYCEARFGKSAAIELPTALQGAKDYLTMPQLTEQTLPIRNAIEESVRQEQKLKARAKALAVLARSRIAGASQSGIAGQVSDLIRALVPGLSPAASTDTLEKTGGLVSYTTPEAEEKYDALHALAVGGGAGLGTAVQRGMLSTSGGQQQLGKLIAKAQGALLPTAGKQQELSQLIASVLAGAKPTLAQAPVDTSLAKLLVAAHDAKPGPAKVALEKLIATVRSGKLKPVSPAKVLPQVARAGTLRGMLGTAKSVLTGKGVPAAAAARSTLLKRLAGIGKNIRLGGGKGALVGAAIATLPFAIRRWLINRQMRAKGGLAATEAATTAEANIAAAKKLQEWRQRQLSQLEQAVGPGAPAWTPPVTAATPGPEPAPKPAPGPFSRYELTPFQS